MQNLVGAETVWKHFLELTCVWSILRIHLCDHISKVDTQRMCSIKRNQGTIKERQLKWLGHVLWNPPVYLQHQILLAEPLGSWKRHQGGQKKPLEPSSIRSWAYRGGGGFRRLGHRWKNPMVLACSGAGSRLHHIVRTSLEDPRCQGRWKRLISTKITSK